jgi:hypothetical protein
LSFLGVASPCLLIHGRVGLDHIRGHARERAKPGELGVYGSGSACDLLHARGSHIPRSWGGYVMACMTFYEWWFGVPSHRFLYSLLQLYGLELHHLTPSGTLHKATFVTLYESYMGIEPHFNMWNYFFHTQLQQGSSEEMVALGSVDIFVRSGPKVDPYYHLPMSDPKVELWKVRFFLRKDADAPLPMFTGSRPIPEPKWRYGVARKDLHKPQPQCDVVQQLL